MNRFSVWDNGARRYNYYDAPGTRPIHAGAPPRVHGGTLGATPEQAAWPLPISARKVGAGELPQGRIASLGGADTTDHPWAMTVVYAALGFFIWKAIR